MTKIPKISNISTLITSSLVPSYTNKIKTAANYHLKAKEVETEDHQFLLNLTLQLTGKKCLKKVNELEGTLLCRKNNRQTQRKILRVFITQGMCKKKKNN